MSTNSLTSSTSSAIPVSDGDVAAVREFTRFYTSVLGLLREGLLDTPYSLTEARIIFELARKDEVEVAAVRRWLDLDPGYLSRILARFEADGLVRKSRSAGDARRQVIGLTQAGRAVFGKLDALSSDQIRRLLAPIPAGRRSRLTAAMAGIREVLGDAARGDHAGEGAWIAELRGEPAGCVFCMRKSDQTAQLRLLLVEPSARGMGIGERLVAECLAFARRAGYRDIVLWTNDVLHAARRIYQRAGFELVREEPHHSFGSDLVGQDWRLALA